MKTNLRILKKTRRRPQAGDIFVFQLESLPDQFFFGRVIATNTTIGGLHPSEFKEGIGVVLIYLYRTASFDKNIIPSLSPADLLLPPIGTNTKPWSLGFFEVVKSGENKPEDLLPIHCFRDFRGWFLDEYGNRLPSASEPVGIYGIAGIGAIDADVSKALGVSVKQDSISE